MEGEPMEFEWNIFPGFTKLQLVQEVQKFMKKWANQNNSVEVMKTSEVSSPSFVAERRRFAMSFV